jgi:hypothetical protein
MRIYKSFALVLAFLFAVVAVCGAQEESKATVQGYVAKESGATQPKVEVTLKLKSCKCKSCPEPKKCDCCPDQMKAQTDDTGFFTFSIYAGTYSLQALGTTVEVDVDAGETKTVNIIVR